MAFSVVGHIHNRALPSPSTPHKRAAPMWNSTGCPSINVVVFQQSEFWDQDAIHWDQHRVGWAAAGGCACLTLLITFVNVMSHVLDYRAPAEQRQIIRILYMPPIFGIISFFSYRFFREYTYYSVSVVLYEAIVISAFMLLLVESLASTTDAGTTHAALMCKDKCKLPIPFCCWRYRPSKAYFMHTIKWIVMQYAIVQPATSIISVITESFNLLCSSSFSPNFANLYLTIVTLLSNSLAFYGLVIFYELTKRDLKGRRPAAKFWCVNIIVTLPFIQQFFFSLLQGAGAIKATRFWTSTNIANGLNALCICVEMVVFSLVMCWAFPVSEYQHIACRRGHPLRAVWDSINFSDFAIEIWRALKFFFDYALDKPGTRSHTTKERRRGYGGRAMFADVFGTPSIPRTWSRISKLKLAGRGRSDTCATAQTQSCESVSSGEVEAQLSAKEIARRPSSLPRIEPPVREMLESLSETKMSEEKISETTEVEGKIPATTRRES